MSAKNSELAVGKWLASLLLAVSAGCSNITISVPGYSVAPAPPPGHLIAGVARVDITPPSGYPMGGHGLGGRFSRGHWGRLYARAFYLRDAAGNSMILVSTDLWGIPAGLQETVAELANAGIPATTSPTERERRILGSAGTIAPCHSLSPHADIGRENLLLHGTHTHLGPGNYLSSEFYNDFVSQYPGFDQRQFDFLALRIACAVSLAADDAATHSGEEATLRWTSATQLSGLARNRAIASLKRDDASLRSRLMNLGPVTAGCSPLDPSPAAGCLRETAVDATLTKLTIARATAPIGALIFFAVHPLALSDHVSVNSPDFTGFAMGDMERQMQASGNANFVAAFFNGAEGDVTPRWKRQDGREALRLARMLATAALNANANPVNVDTKVTVSTRRFATTQKSFCYGALPLLGVATMGGGEDGRSVAFDAGWRAPERAADQMKSRKRSFLYRLYRDVYRLIHPVIGQEPKSPALDFPGLPGLGLTDVVGNANKFPKAVPASLFRIGTRVLVAVPFEMTSAAALELKDMLGASDQILVVGLANEYLSYMTTRDEYQEQDYEGSSTIYGHESVKCLAALLQSTPTVEVTVAPHDFDAGPPPTFGAVLGPEFWGRNGQFQDASLEAPFAPAGRPTDRLPRFEWRHCHEDDGIELLHQINGSWVAETDDEQGKLLVELVEGREGKMRGGTFHRTWAALWLARKSDDVNQPHKFRVTPRSYGEADTDPCGPMPICSASFTLAGLDAAPPDVILPGACPPP